MFSSEVRWALRRLRADRWAAGGAILVSALGIGLNTSVFTVAYGVLVRPLPYASPERLVIIEAGTALARVDEWRAGLSSLEAAAAYTREPYTIYGAGEPRLASVALVGDAFFDTLGSRPEHGTLFTTGAVPSEAAVISERFARQSGWTARDGPGRHLTVGAAAVTVVAVMPAAFAFPSEGIDLWIPAQAAPAIAFDRSADARRFNVVGRLKPQAGLAQVAGEAARTHHTLDPVRRREERPPIKVTMVRDQLLAPARPVLIACAAAAMFVLVIAAANIAAILVSRTLARRQELAIRRAVGAPVSRLAAGVLAESVLVNAGGAVAGSVLAIAAVPAFARAAAGLVPRLQEIHVDWKMFALAVLFATVSSVLAVLPAFRSLLAAPPMLRTVSGAERSSVRGALTMIQIALAVILLAGGGLLTRTILALLGADIGASRSAIVSQLMLTRTLSFDAAERGPALQEMLRRIRSLPGVTAAGCGSNLPPSSDMIDMTIRLIDGRGDRRFELSLASVTPGYLPAIGARLLHGRDFTADDDTRAEPVVVISAAAARALFDGEAVGRQMPADVPGLRGRQHPTVIGVVSDVRYSGLEIDARPAIYVPWSALPAGHPFLVIASSTGVASLAPAVLMILRDVDPRMPLQPVRTLDEVVSQSVADRRLRALLGGSVALLAFSVAIVGLLGSLTRAVTERRRELAIRAALGATPAQIVRTIVQLGVLVAGVGLAIGIAGAMIAGQLLRPLLHGVDPQDPATLVSVALVVAAASLAACYVPARRAARVDPLALLRAE